MGERGGGSRKNSRLGWKKGYKPLENSGNPQHGGRKQFQTFSGLRKAGEVPIDKGETMQRDALSGGSFRYFELGDATILDLARDRVSRCGGVLRL